MLNYKAMLEDKVMFEGKANIERFGKSIKRRISESKLKPKASSALWPIYRSAYTRPAVAGHKAVDKYTLWKTDYRWELIKSGYQFEHAHKIVRRIFLGAAEYLKKADQQKEQQKRQEIPTSDQQAVITTTVEKAAKKDQRPAKKKELKKQQALLLKRRNADANSVKPDSVNLQKSRRPLVEQGKALVALGFTAKEAAKFVVAPLRKHDRPVVQHKATTQQTPPLVPVKPQQINIQNFDGHQRAALRAGLSPSTPGIHTMSFEQMKAAAAEITKQAADCMREKAGLRY